MDGRTVLGGWREDDEVVFLLIVLTSSSPLIRTKGHMRKTFHGNEANIFLVTWEPRYLDKID